MKKRYFFLVSLLMTLASTMLPSSAYAADPPKADYDRAMAAFTDGAYYITTEVDGVKYYITSQGGLTEFEDEGGVFNISKSTGGELYDVGLFIDAGTGEYFTNTNLENSKAILNFGSYRMSNGNNRATWERQVPFMNEEGLIAIRSCNTAYGESSWNDAGRTFWTYEVAEEGDYPTPVYSYEAAYIWTFEKPAGKAEVLTILNPIYEKYSEYEDDTNGDYLGTGIGTEPGQYADAETWQQFLNLLEEIGGYLSDLLNPDYDYEADPNHVTATHATELVETLEALFQKVLDSEVVYSLPNGDGYYRIIANTPYHTNDGYVEKAFAASYYDDHKNKGVYATLDRNSAHFLWKLNQHGDSIAIQNAGMGTFVSIESDQKEERVIMTDDEANASHVTFDYAGIDYVDFVGDDQDIFYFRLSSAKRGRYLHQLGHGSATYEDSPSSYGNAGTDQGTDVELGFWVGTYNRQNQVDKGTSEWYLEYVPEEEAQSIIAAFGEVKNHALLVAQNNALRAEVYDALVTAKDTIRTKLITDVAQLSSPNSDPSEGKNIGNLIDNNSATFWHTSWHNENSYPRMEYDGIECHYLQISGMENLVGDCELYFREREGADNDRPAKVVLMGANELPEIDDDAENYVDDGSAWTEIAVFELPHTGKGEENTLAFTTDEAFSYVRVLVTEVNSSFRTFWHASEIQLYTVRENPNSQFALLGEVAETLDEVYNGNVATPDEDITQEMYDALLNAYKEFMAAMVDPTELRTALATYAKATAGVVEGTNPGQWADTEVADQFEDLYAEVQAYNEAGRYNAVQNHRYAIMLKAMAKTVNEQVNGLNTNTWYRIQYPTEEQFDAYKIDKAGGSPASSYETQPYQWGGYVVAGKMIYEDVEDEDGNTSSKLVDVEALASEDIREDVNGLFFMDDDLIEDKDASLFRFVERKANDADVTAPFQDAKDNVQLALDMSTAYTQGPALITSASQLSSNASDRSEGLHIENLIDGNTGTYWHSDYHKDVLEPGYIQVALNEPVSGLIQVYIARRNTANGHIVRMYVQGSNDAENWTNIGYIETPFTNVTTPATSQPIELGGTFSHLRFTMTYRYGTDGGGNMEFDPFADVTSPDDYNKKFTYFHASEFQIYPVTAGPQQSESAQALQQAYTAANKIILKDVVADDVTSIVGTYRAYRDVFNQSIGKTVLPYGKDKAEPSYAIQNKATGLFVNAAGSNSNDVYLKLIPSFFEFSAPGYERSLLHGKTIAGADLSYLHSQNWNHRFVTWNATAISSNSALIISEAEPVEDLDGFTFYKDIKPGRINNWCNSVTITPQVEAGVEAHTYSMLGRFIDDTGDFLALKEVTTIPAGYPAFFILDDTLSYDTEDDYVEPIEFTMPAQPELVEEGDTINGAIGCISNHTLKAHEIYFSGNHAVCIGKTGYYVTPNRIVVDIDNCPWFNPSEEDFDFAICLDDQGSLADGIDAPAAIEKISQRGNVYSVDGKLLMSGATLGNLKTLGKGMYILNGVKVLVK